MDKEAQLRALRELTANTANKSANSPVNKLTESANRPVVSNPAAVDDIAVMKYLDGLRRKAVSIEEVDIIDVIVKSLFYQGVNKVTGRVHGRPSPLNDQSPEQKSEEKPKSDRNAYQREYMRKRRAKNAVG
jgi:hypothetical protein